MRRVVLLRCIFCKEVPLDWYTVINVCDMMKTNTPYHRGIARRAAEQKLLEAIYCGEDIVYADTLATREEIFSILRLIKANAPYQVTIVDYFQLDDPTEEQLAIQASYEQIPQTTYHFK